MSLLEMQILGPHPRGPQVTAALIEIWDALRGSPPGPAPTVCDSNDNGGIGGVGHGLGPPSAALVATELCPGPPSCHRWS